MMLLAEPWLPILVSAVMVFITGAVIHMMLPIHKGEGGKPPNDDAVLKAMRGAAAARPGGRGRGGGVDRRACELA